MIINGKEPKNLLLGHVPLTEDMFRYNLAKWVAMDAGNDIDVSLNKVVIRRFKPNKWILHSPQVHKDSDGGNKSICEYTRGARIAVSGLQANSSIFAYKDMTNNHGAGSDIPHCKGLCFYPYSTDGYLMMERMYTWEACWSETGRNLSPVADYPAFRHDGNGHGRYGIFNDYSDIQVVPEELVDFNTWARANNGSAQGWFFAFGLYTSNTDILDEEGYVNLETPITIELVPIKGIDITKREIWALARGKDIIYEKERNLETCWIWHGLAQRKNGVIQVDGLSAKDYPNYVLPEVPDWEDYIMTDGSFLTWNIKCSNTEIWDTFREWYKNHTIRIEMLGRINGHNSIFNDSSFNGEVMLNIKGTTIQNGEVVPDRYLHANEAFSGSDITKVTFNFQDGCTISATHNMFKGAGKLEEIVTNETFGANDCSGTFEFCGNLKSIPSNIVDYSNASAKNGVRMTNMGWYVEYSGIIEVPIFNEEGLVVYDDGSRFARRNIVVVEMATQMMNGANSLRYFGPVIDMMYCPPRLANKAFCADNLEDVRIKNLNHGSWHLDYSYDGEYTQGNLRSLNQESIKYLFDNLCDLTTYEEDSEDPANPEVPSADIYCPSTWSDKVTDEMVSEANSKGWTIYIGGVKRG